MLTRKSLPELAVGDRILLQGDDAPSVLLRLPVTSGDDVDLNLYLLSLPASTHDLLVRAFNDGAGVALNVDRPGEGPTWSLIVGSPPTFPVLID